MPATINPARLVETLQSTCTRWGAAHRHGINAIDTGMARLSLNNDDFAIRNWLRDECRQLGLTETVDEVGNMFFVRAGTNKGAPTAMGSHLDTQPTGGRYDGIVGVMAGLEVMRTLNDNKITTKYPIALVDWTNEEGARFPKSMTGSSVWSGKMTREEAWDLVDVHDDKTSFKSELERGGFLGTVSASHEAVPLGAHFELHIEQGPILENHEKKIGIVVGGQAYQWIMIKLQGRESHTGSTPFEARSDALLAAAKIIVAATEIAKKHGGLASTGILTLQPGSVNTSAGLVEFSLDSRHYSGEALVKQIAEIKQRAEEICAKESERGVSLAAWDVTFDSPEINFDPECISSVTKAAHNVVGADLSEEIRSGAGHDSCSTSAQCPTSMIFIPCRGGLSHHPEEFSTSEQIADGAQVLLEAVLDYDAKRS